MAEKKTVKVKALHAFIYSDDEKSARLWGVTFTKTADGFVTELDRAQAKEMIDAGRVAEVS